MDKEFQYGRIEDLVELKEYLLKFAKKKKQYIKIIILDNYFIGASGYVLGQLVLICIFLMSIRLIFLQTFFLYIQNL